MSGLIEAVRGRVRVRTRLRRVRDAWRSRFPRPLPAWTDPSAPEPPEPEPRRRGTEVVAGRVTVAAGAAGPQGRQRYETHQPTGRLSLDPDPTGGAGWRVTRAPGAVTVVAGRVGSPLDERQRAVLAKLGVVTCEGGVSGPPEAALAEVLAQLATTGVVLHTPARPAGSLLAPELAALLAAPLPARDADPMEWEIRSVRQRRAALRGHGAGLTDPPSVTALLVTKRPRLAARAVAALAAQSYPNLEIVVGLHGAGEAPPEFASAGRPLRVVPVAAARCLGEALAEASAAATGELVTKVDDDDHYGREHIWDLVLARHYSGATVVGKGSEFVYLEPKDLTVRRRMAAELLTDTVAGGTIALARDELAAVGGWPPVPRWVDRALLDQVIAAGGQIYRTHPIGFVYTRHGDGHTWDADLGYFLRDPVRKWRGLPPYDEFDG